MEREKEGMKKEEMEREKEGKRVEGMARQRERGGGGGGEGKLSKKGTKGRSQKNFFSQSS